MTDVQTKHLVNAGDSFLVYTAVIDGCEQTWNVTPYEGLDVPLSDDELAQQVLDQEAAAAAAAAPATPEQLAAVPVKKTGENLTATFRTTDEFAHALDQLHLQAKQGIADFKKDIADWPTLTDDQKLSHVLGLMTSVVGILQFLTGDFS